MTYKDQFPLPILAPWVDLTPLKGTTVANVSISDSYARSYRSVLHLGTIRTVTDPIGITGGRWDIDAGGPVYSYPAKAVIYPCVSSASPSYTSTMWGTFRGGETYSAISKGRIYNRWIDPSVIASTYGTMHVTRMDTLSTSTDITVSESYPAQLCIRSEDIGPYIFGQYCYNSTNSQNAYSPFKVSRGWMRQYCIIRRVNTGFAYEFTDAQLEVIPIMKALPIYRTSTGSYTEKDTASYVPICYAPSRPLPSAPTLIESCTSVDHVTIGGRTYHMQHSKRKLWSCEILLDGCLDPETGSNPSLIHGPLGDGLIPSGGLDAITGWDRFMHFAEKGVTLWVDDLCGAGLHVRPRYSVAFPGVPNVISGQLVGVSQMRLVEENGLNRRFSVTLTIAEENPY